MKATTDILLDHTLEIINRIAEIKGLGQFVHAKMTGMSNQSQSIYFTACDADDNYTDFRFSDHRDCHPEQGRINVRFEELENWGIIAQDPNWEATFDDDYDYEVWLSEEKSYNDEAFIYVKS